MSSDEKDGVKRYNGWTNYETWCVHLWLSNEEGSYRYWRKEARKQRSKAPSCANVTEGIWNVEDAAMFNLADQMKSELEVALPIEAASMFSDLLTAALSEVDWHEVAEAFLEHLEPEPTDDQEGEETEHETSDQGDGPKGPLFALGQVVSTPGALAALGIEDIETALRRHVTGDWGEMFESEKRENDLAVKKGWQIHSAYRGEDYRLFWVITEADRSVTTVLLPKEY